MKTTHTILLSLTTLSLIGCGDSYSSNEDAQVLSQPLQSATREVRYLTDLEGMSLYSFDKDTLDISNCDSDCQKIWPLFRGVDNGSEDIKPLDTTQLAYRQHPLYYFVNDNQAGDVNGDDVKEVWHLIYSTTNPDESQTKLSTDTMVQSYLTDHNGVALYTFDKDEANVSNCYGACEDTWPIYYNENISSLPTGVSKEDFGTITRDAEQSTTGILKQSTYKGQPLYYFTPDNNEAGATKGDWVKGVWHLIELDATKSAQATNDNAQKVADGKSKFESSCTSCHGSDGKTPALGVSQIIADIGDAATIESLLKNMRDNGAASGKHSAMVGVASGLSDADIANLSAYVATLKK